MKLTLGSLEIDAHSIGGVETCFQIPDFDCCLDIGRCPPGAENRKTLLLTHAHIDHAAGLPYYVSMRSLMGMKPPRIYCPAASRDALQQILDGWAALQADSDRCTLEGVEPDDRIDLRRGFAKVYRSPHRITTVGYTLYRTKKKLRDDLTNASREEIVERARSGEDVNQLIETAELSFPGDTLIDVVDKEPSVTQARVLLLECTFMAPKMDVARARRTGHVHFDEIAARADKFDNEVVLLTHFSRRHSRREIEKAVESLPKQFARRVQILVHD